MQRSKYNKCKISSVHPQHCVNLALIIVNNYILQICFSVQNPPLNLHFEFLLVFRLFKHLSDCMCFSCAYSSYIYSSCQRKQNFHFSVSPLPTMTPSNPCFAQQLSTYCCSNSTFKEKNTENTV